MLGIVLRILWTSAAISLFFEPNLGDKWRHRHRDDLELEGDDETEENEDDAVTRLVCAVRLERSSLDVVNVLAVGCDCCSVALSPIKDGLQQQRELWERDMCTYDE